MSMSKKKIYKVFPHVLLFPPSQVIKVLTVSLSSKWNISTFWHQLSFSYLAHHKFKAWDPFSFSCNSCFTLFWSCELYSYISQGSSWQTATHFYHGPVHYCTVLSVHVKCQRRCRGNSLKITSCLPFSYAKKELRLVSDLSFSYLYLRSLATLSLWAMQAPWHHQAWWGQCTWKLSVGIPRDLHFNTIQSASSQLANKK